MMQLRVKTCSWEAPNILSYDLRPTTNVPLPPFSAGAHIELALGNKMRRSYSLLNPPSERHRYVVAVQKDRQGRGGSMWLHQNLRVGDLIAVDEPRNHFPLDEEAERSVFIAGGIGITPILSMIERLNELGRQWDLHYCARTRSTAAFLEHLSSAKGVNLNFDREPGGAILDIGSLFAGAKATTHFYCCGPTSMLLAFENAAKQHSAANVHLEYFTGAEPPATEGGFTIVLAQSGRELPVPAGKTILETLTEAGVQIRTSCVEGVCGTCETRVLGGMPDHRDRILTSGERDANTKIMVCCSGSKSENLVLDL
jgi:vanillate O-demethylase ferredoxin subunit